MKKRYIILTACILLIVLTFSACKSGNDGSTESVAEYCTITFDTWGGSEIEPIRVMKGNKASKPADPKKDGFIFNGWSHNGKDWFFEINSVKEDMTLSAKWVDVENVYEIEGDTDKGFTVTKIKKEYENMIVPESVRGGKIVAIGDDVFYGVSDTVLSITVAESVTSVGKNAFREVGVDLVVKGALTEIGEGAFYECKTLESVRFGEGLVTVAPMAFFGCSALTELEFPSTLEKIDENAFEDCTAVTAIIMHNKTATVCDGAFFNMSSLGAVYYYGSQTDVDAMSIAVMNDEFKEVIESDVYFYSAEKPTEKGNYWYFSDSGRIRIWEDK